ncbi:hypothetical protein [Actinoplanes sp. NPDC051494]|uniref:hypothetical protein n=1 Tax=Actinoplanes sp. NPDC051494 TaxID=3363907 RepID=UPI00379C716C
MSDPEHPRGVSLVFDATAILAYADQSIAVGEALTQVSENGAAAGLPLACLVEAVQLATDRDRLRLLAGHEATVLLDGDATDWEAVSELHGLVGAYSATSAAWAAIDSQTWVLSARPDLYSKLDGGQLAIPFVH